MSSEISWDLYLFRNVHRTNMTGWKAGVLETGSFQAKNDQLCNNYYRLRDSRELTRAKSTGAEGCSRYTYRQTGGVRIEYGMPDKDCSWLGWLPARDSRRQFILCGGLTKHEDYRERIHSIIIGTVIVSQKRRMRCEQIVYKQRGFRKMHLQHGIRGRNPSSSSQNFDKIWSIHKGTTLDRFLIGLQGQIFQYAMVTSPVNSHFLKLTWFRCWLVPKFCYSIEPDILWTVSLSVIFLYITQLLQLINFSSGHVP